MESVENNTGKMVCENCGFEVPFDLSKGKPDNSPCPKCKNSWHISLNFHDQIEAHDDTGIKLKDPTKTGKNKIAIEGKVGTELHSNSQTLQYRERIIDRRADRYDEIIDNPTLGYHKEDHGKLSDHKGHGSDKNK